MKVFKSIAISVLLTTSTLSGYYIYQQTLEIKQLKELQRLEIERLHSIQMEERENAEILIATKSSEIDRLNTALDTAFRQYEVVKTLLDTDMEDWTADSILETESRMASLPNGSWFKDGHYVTAPFGSTALVGTHWGAKGHRGVDIKPRSGNNYEPIISPIAGKVVTWGRNDRLFGNYLVIESQDGLFQMKLAHLSTIAIVKDGVYDLAIDMEFDKGTRIATMGNTGHTTGPHLHVEYYIYDNDNWRLLNASAILDYMGETTNEM